MEPILVWTKQSKLALDMLERTGRYFGKKEYVCRDLEEHAPLMLETYNWLVAHSPNAQEKPADVDYPVWVSFIREATMLPEPGTVTLELAVDPARITRINISKWGTILNYSYIPADGEDEKRHQALLERYGVSDPQAYMSRFYPHIKREIIASWDRLFDDSIQLDNPNCYGILWEIKREWITKILR